MANLKLKVATQVLGGTTKNPTLYINVDGKKIYLNGSAKADADGNLIGDIEAEEREVDSLQKPGTKFKAYWALSFTPDSLKIRQAENNARLARVTRQAAAYSTASDEVVATWG